MNVKFLSLLLFLPISFSVMAQQVTLSQSKTEAAGPNHKIFACSDGDYLVLTYPFDGDRQPLMIARYDPASLAPRYTNTLEEIAQQTFRAAMHIGEHVFVITTDREGKVLKWDIDDKSGRLRTEPVRLFTIGVKDNDYQFYAGSSAGRHAWYLAVAKDRPRDKVSIIQGILLNEQMGRIAPFTYTSDGTREDGEKALPLAQAENGSLYIVLATPGNNYTLLTIDVKGHGAESPLKDLPQGKLQNFAIFPRENDLVLTAFLKGKKDNGFAGMVSGRFDLAQKAFLDIKTTPLKTLIHQPQDIIAYIEKTWLAADVTIRGVASQGDGGSMLVLERNPYPPAESFADANSGSIGYPQRGDLYVVRVDKEGQPQWMNVIPRRQEELDHVVTIGTAIVTGENDKLHLFYYDDKKDTEPATAKRFSIHGKDYSSNALACLTIDADGRMSKQLTEIPAFEYRWNVERAATGTKGRLVLMAIKPVSSPHHERFFSKSAYRLSVAEVK